MSGGMNKSFMTNPRRFMQAHTIHLSRMDQLTRIAQPVPIPDAGLQQFDLRRDYEGSVQLSAFEVRGPGSTQHAHRINAYWLPWGGANTTYQFATPTTEILLRDEANFFFTSQLAGCQMLMATQGDAVRVFHIPGNMHGSAWRRTEGERLLGGDYDRARRWSSTQDYGADNIVNFIGVRRAQGWIFYSQSLETGAVVEVACLR